MKLFEILKLVLLAHAVKVSLIKYYPPPRPNFELERPKICLGENLKLTLLCPWDANITHITWDIRLGLISKSHIWNESPVQVHCMILDAWGWCTETTQRDGRGREKGEGFRMGNMCIPVVDSCWCMAKPMQCCKVVDLQFKKKKKVKAKGKKRRKEKKSSKSVNFK